jgi:uncharacterized membrane protein
MPDDNELAPVAPRWAALASTVICVLAFADSAYLTYAHYVGPRALYCSYNPKSFVDCSAVTTGPYSEVFGIPVAVLGLAWSAGMLVLCSPWAWRAPLWEGPAWRRWAPWVGRLRLLGSAAGVLMVFWLVYVELYKKHHLCEYCTVVHALTVVLFGVVAFGTALALPVDGPEDLGPEVEA